ncbi:MAG: hypothetical protein ABJC10_02645 [Acidobacteriota bacterium]
MHRVTCRDDRRSILHVTRWEGEGAAKIHVFDVMQDVMHSGLVQGNVAKPEVLSYYPDAVSRCI